jgi:hypothetical protein
MYQGNSFVSVHRGEFPFTLLYYHAPRWLPNPKMFQRGDAAPAARVPLNPFNGIRGHRPVQSVEEEQVPFYSRDDHYPMRIGAVIKDHYQVVAKLSYGTNPTLWLCHDLRYALLPFQI